MFFFSWLQSALTSTMILFSITLSSLFLYESDFSFSSFMFQLSLSLSPCLTVVLEHAAGIWWMITCHSLFIIIQTINYTSLMPVVPLEIYMLGTDQCENGISFAKCLSVGTAWWLQSGCFNSCVCLTMSSLTACHRSHCSKALFIVLCGLRLSEDKDAAKATMLKAGRQGRSQSRHTVSAPITCLCFHWCESLYPLHLLFFYGWLPCIKRLVSSCINRQGSGRGEMLFMQLNNPRTASDLIRSKGLQKNETRGKAKRACKCLAKMLCSSRCWTCWERVKCILLTNWVVGFILPFR